MADFTILPLSRVRELYTAAISLRLYEPGREAALLSGIAPGIIATLPQAGPPSDQLFEALPALNALTPGSVELGDPSEELPLEIWLNNVVTTNPARVETRTFQQALEDLRAFRARPREENKPALIVAP